MTATVADPPTRVFVGWGSTQAHLLRFGDSADDGQPAVCGRRPGRHPDWLGTGSQAEYDQAARLPLCPGCAS